MSSDPDNFEDFARDAREFQGKVLQALDGLDKHLASVSAKASEVREGLEEHKENPNAHSGPIMAAVGAHDKEPAAHGARAAHQGLGQAISIVCAALSAGAFIMTVWRSSAR